ncbi:Fatty acid desaturase [Maioricimonas rarisocia]|uniref:Fatty acid desaturase n=1 Tax=Maioricimonas rarisocia TaxID=2528026 RepID=A0A517Z0Q9_9PLAN|nr:fatty acid desaturase family protein [Maioricimonas rarisocia]QDU36064.1 Fatty acid desaturase [Maioricimonas rarisocia]
MSIPSANPIADVPSAEGGPSAADAADRQFFVELRRLSRLNVWRCLSEIALDWCVIAACFAVCVQVWHPAVWAVAAVIIATRQHALLIVMHDASHYRLLPNKHWNDLVSNVLLSWPLIVSTEAYRANHLAHHSHLNTDDDPDWVRKRGKAEWEFPKTKWQLLCLLARDCLGAGFVAQLRALRDLSSDKRPKPVGSRWPRLAFYGVAATAITAANLWIPVLVLWFIPVFTLLPVILRIRSIAEHFGLEREHELNSSRNFIGPLWERLLFAPHNVGYHLDHHLYPSVPFYNLPKLHRLLQSRPDYAQRAHQNAGLVSGASRTVLDDVLAGAKTESLNVQAG